MYLDDLIKEYDKNLPDKIKLKWDLKDW
jgi:hypothetical protein